jgi:membrane fusion protein, adhesin transport system
MSSGKKSNRLAALLKEIEQLSERAVSGLDRLMRRRPRRGFDEEEAPASARIVIGLVGGLIAVFLIWAAFTELDEVTRGAGKVIPSSKTQIVQASEAGVIQEMHVRLGQRVRKDDLLIRLDKTTTASSLGELEARGRALAAQVARLNVEYEGGAPEGFACPQEVQTVAPGVCVSERNMLDARLAALENQTQVFAEREEQKRRELKEMEANVARLRESLGLAQNELKIITPLAKDNVVPETDFLRAKREVADLRGQLAGSTEAQGRIEAELREATAQLEKVRLIYRQEALAEMTEKLSELSVIREATRGAADRVKRTDIRSPVDGIVNHITFTTIGAFVNRGDRVVDIVPIEEQLLVEARVPPKDIAFIRPGQKATVKVTAYDYAVYGGLDGEVQHIAADTAIDEVTREPYYTVLVKTEQSALSHNGKNYAIIPGMVCTAEILTGRKSILDYLLKPINRARQEALRER